MSRFGFLIASLLIFAVLGSAACVAESPSTHPKLDRATAEKTALTRVPGGRIREGELEREHGRLVWSFDIAKPDTRDITEVQVDATTGKIVSVATETPADQAREAAEDRAKTHPAPR